MKACGTCTLCCKVCTIVELNKPSGQWCVHARPGQGCAIYGDHPKECQVFRCGWLTIDELGEDWKPINSKFVLLLDEDRRRLVIENDPGHPQAWKKAPFSQQIKSWARAWTVIASVGKHCIFVFPDQDIDVGPIEAGDEVRRGFRGEGPLKAPWVRVRPVGGGPPREYVGRFGPTA